MTSARDLMTPDPRCVGEKDSLIEAARLLRDLDVGALPICGEDVRLKGMLTDRDIVVGCVAEGYDPSTTTAGDLAQGTPRWVMAGDDVGDALQEMQSHQIRRLPVIDENKRLVGMISECDLVSHLPQDQLAQWAGSVYAMP